MKRSWLITKRVLAELVRDKRTLAMVFLAPIFLIFLLNTMFTASSSTNITVATVGVSSSVNKNLDKTKHVNVRQYSSEADAKKALKNHNVNALIVKHSDTNYTITYENTDYSKTALTKSAFNSAVIKSNTAKLKQALTKSIAATKKLQQQVAKLTSSTATASSSTATSSSSTSSSSVHITQKYQYGNADTGYFTKIAPILIGFFVFLLVFLISGMAMLKERSTGTLDRLLATPVRRSEIVGGYMLSYGLIAIIQTLDIVFSAIWIINLDIEGSIWLILLVNILFALVALSFGLFLSTLAQSEFQMMQLIPLLVLPQIFFSGIIPLDSMADWVQWLGKLLPLTYAGDALSGIILYGESFNDISGDLLALLIFLVILVCVNVIGLKRYRKV